MKYKIGDSDVIQIKKQSYEEGIKFYAWLPGESNNRLDVFYLPLSI